MVLIDSTRFAHLGIMATLFHSANIGINNSTVFVVENDYWVDGGKKRNTLDLLRENMQLEILVDRAVPGEQWPWFVVRGGFARVPNSKLQGTAAERRQRRKERLEQRSAGLTGDVWAHSHQVNMASAARAPFNDRAISHK
jgi:hypothetical protein